MKEAEVMEEAVLKGKDISFKYGSSLILDKCSFEVNNGDFSVIIGPNGSGKSTLLRICLGLLNQNSGIVELFGEPINKFTDWNRIGYVPQKLSTFNQGFPATVSEVVKTPLYAGAALLKKNKAEISKKALEALASVEMEEYHDRLIGKLSTGQQQRVFIAKALINNPELIFMDEPTAGIDNKSEEEFYNLLYDLNKEKHITIIMVTHDFTDIKSMVNKVFSLNDGFLTEKNIIK